MPRNRLSCTVSIDGRGYGETNLAEGPSVATAYNQRRIRGFVANSAVLRQWQREGEQPPMRSSAMAVPRALEFESLEFR
jgi:hypothetical protein